MANAHIALPAATKSAGPVVTDFDLRRLRGLIDLLRQRGDDPTLDVLELELELAAVVDAHQVPASVVTMNSTVEVVDLDTGARHTFTVVFPGAAATTAGRVSVLAPIGTALLGARVGDEVTWPAPGRTRRARIDAVVYQPEAAGHYEL